MESSFTHLGTKIILHSIWPHYVLDFLIFLSLSVFQKVFEAWHHLLLIDHIEILQF